MNSIVHFELPAKVKEAKKFYEDVFGWKIQDAPEYNYAMVYTSEVDENYMPTTPGAVNGGMLSIEENGGLNPILVISVPSIDEAIIKIEENGGEIVKQKSQVGDMGYYAKFKDVSGVVMGIWENINNGN